MSGVPGRYSSSELSRELTEFRGTVKRYRSSPPNNDPRAAAYFEAVDTDWDIIVPSLTEGFRARREVLGTPIRPALMVNLVQRAMSKQIARVDPDPLLTQIAGDNLTAGYLDPESYMATFPEFLPTSEAELLYHDNEFVSDICIRAVMSNVVERAKSLQLLNVAFADRIGPTRRIGDFGCSANRWLMAMALGHSLSPLEVLRSKHGKLINDRLASLAVNSALTVHPQIGKSVGFDEWPWDRDEDIKRWARICTLNWAELAKSLEMEKQDYPFHVSDDRLVLSPLREYMYFDERSSPLVNFARLDITDDEQVAEFQKDKKNKSREFDLVNAGTALHQLSPERRNKFLETMERLKSSPDVLTAVVDFARPNPKNPHELLFEEDIYAGKWLYRMLVLDPLNPTGWQEILIFETGRCQRVQLGLGRISVNGQLRTIGEQLLGLYGAGD